MTESLTTVEIRRRLPAAPARVFGAFADPVLVARSLSPSPEIQLEVLEFDFRVGGRYRFAYHLLDGRTVAISGAYLTIARTSKLVFSWIIEPPAEHAGINSEVTVTISPVGDSSDLVIHHRKLGRLDAVTRHSAGWVGALDQLTALLTAAGGPGGP